MNTCNICFHGEIGKNISTFWLKKKTTTKKTLSGAMHKVSYKGNRQTVYAVVSNIIIQ